MVKVNKKRIYESFHKNRKLQKRIIPDNNFTYRHLIKIISPYLANTYSVLDIGCGVGTIDFYLASKGKKVTAIDISENAINIARQNASLFKLDNNIEFINDNFSSKNFKNKYDLVILSEVLEHIEDESNILRNIRQVIKKSGILVITVPSENAPLYRLGILHKFDKSVGHLRRYSQNKLILLLEKNGFKIIKMGKNEGILRNFLFTNSIAGKLLRFIKWKISDFISLIDNITLPLFGESNLWVVVKKINK